MQGTMHQHVKNDWHPGLTECHSGRCANDEIKCRLGLISRGAQADAVSYSNA